MINSTSGAKRVRDSRGGWYIIISPVSDDTAHQSGYLDKKVGQSAGVPDLLGCQAGRHKCAALQIEADMQFAPYLAGLRQPVLLPHPLAATVDTKPCAVQNQPDRITGCQGVECDLKRWCTPAKRRKIRHGEVRLHEPQQTADKALRLPERTAPHLVTASSLNHTAYVTTLAERLVVFGPIRHTVFCSRKLILQRRIEFERHASILQSNQRTSYASQTICKIRSVTLLRVRN